MTKPKTVKPKRQWEMWALINNDGELIQITDKKYAINRSLKFKKVLVREV
jgi:hypothetical protein